MSDQQVTDFLVKVIGNAIKAADFPLAETGIRTLASINPQRAQEVLDTIQAGLAIQEAGAR
jgi:hypothetical protein